jgi:hypothetical protein
MVVRGEEASSPLARSFLNEGGRGFPFHGSVPEQRGE